MNQSLCAAIPIVMNRFDFAQVHKVMTFESCLPQLQLIFYVDSTSSTGEY